MLPSERLEILRRIARCEARAVADPEYGGSGWCWADHVSWRQLEAEGLIEARGDGFPWQYRLTDAGRMAISEDSAADRGGTIQEGVRS